MSKHLKVIMQACGLLNKIYLSYQVHLPNDKHFKNM